MIAEVGWTEFDFLSHGEESEVMAQLLGAFPPMVRKATMNCLGPIKLPMHTVTTLEAALLSHLHMRATVSVTQMKL